MPSSSGQRPTRGKRFPRPSGHVRSRPCPARFITVGHTHPPSDRDRRNRCAAVRLRPASRVTGPGQVRDPGQQRAAAAVLYGSSWAGAGGPAASVRARNMRVPGCHPPRCLSVPLVASPVGFAGLSPAGPGAVPGTTASGREAFAVPVPCRARARRRQPIFPIFTIEAARPGRANPTPGPGPAYMPAGGRERGGGSGPKRPGSAVRRRRRRRRRRRCG